MLFLVANTLPQEALVYPLYYLAKQVHLYDTRLSVIIVFTVIQSAFGTYLLSSVYRTFPVEILEAARIDGASRCRSCGESSSRSPPDPGGAVHLLLHLDLERVLPAVGPARHNDSQTVPVALGVLQGDRLMDATTTSARRCWASFPP